MNGWMDMGIGMNLELRSTNGHCQKCYFFRNCKREVVMFCYENLNF